MRRIKRLLLLALSLLLALPSGACMQPLTVDDFIYVLDIGVEYGKTMPYLVTFLVTMPKGGSSEGGSTTCEVVSAEARSLFEASETLNSALPYRLNFSRVTLLMVQEDLAKDGAISTFFDFSFGKLNIWPSVRVVVARDPIAELFSGLISESDPSLSKQKTSVGYLESRSGVIADASFSRMDEGFTQKTCDVMAPYCGVTEQALEADLVGDGAYPYVGGSLLVDSVQSVSVCGCAVFDGARMVGVLDGQHTMLVLMVTDAFKRGRLQLETPQGVALTVVLVRSVKPAVSFDRTQSSVEIYLEAELEQPTVLYEMNSEELKAFLETELESSLSRVFLALQANNCDAMGFGRYAMMTFRRAADWAAYDWKADYRSMAVTFHVSCKLLHNPQNIGLE